MTNLADKLRMTHLDLDAERKATEEAVGASAPSAAPAPDERDAEVWSFHFAHKDRRGVVWEGDFVNSILTIAQQTRVGILRARLQGGQPMEAIDADVLDLNAALAHMTYSLDPKARPDWAKGDKLTEIRDAGVIFALWEKVRGHEAIYFRYGSSAAPSA